MLSKASEGMHGSCDRAGYLGYLALLSCTRVGGGWEVVRLEGLEGWKVGRLAGWQIGRTEGRKDTLAAVARQD